MLRYRLTLAAAAVLLFGSNPTAQAGTVLFSSGFDGNTGATVLPGNTDNTSGSSTVGITDWVVDTSVTSISGLTAVTSNDGGATSAGAGFAQLQNGTAAYANPDVIFVNPNHNVGGSYEDNLRGFSLEFELGTSQQLESLTVFSGHTNNTGNQDQAYASDLVFELSGGTLATPLTDISSENYAEAPAYHEVVFDLTGNELGAGTYKLAVYQQNLSVGGAYATFDGVSLEAVPEPTAMCLVVGGMVTLLTAKRRRV